MKRYNIFIVLLLLISLPFISFAQEQEDTLEGNLEYRAFKVELDSLTKVQDGLKSDIEKYKEMSENDQQNDEYINKVLELENMLFDIRNKIGIVTSKCNTIEQEYIIKNLNKKPAGNNSSSTPKLNASSNILSNKFFIDNLSADEMRIMRGGSKIDSVAFHLRDSIKKQYDIINDIDIILRKTQEQSVSDSLFTLAQHAYDLVADYEDALKKEWGEIFETKIYAYTRLLDKLNVSVDVLAKLGEKQREVRHMSEVADTAKFSSPFYVYPAKRELILNYEKLLAEKLVYLTAIDSIEQKIADVKKLQCDYKNINLPEWNYVSFENAKIGGNGIHSTTNSVEKIKIPTLGSVYTIRLATLTNKLSQISSLRRINPVSSFENELGKYEYHAGMYKTKEEAASDLSKIKSAGFSPVITEWRDGGKVLDDGTIIPLDVADYYYAVQFDTVTPEITANLKTLAPNKELSRIDDKYSIGFFKSYLEAVKIKKAIGTESTIVPIKIN